ncbi:MAG: hypothetical protein EFT35_01460, partial [Methanophagales archaeon ANME-1-THS]
MDRRALRIAVLIVMVSSILAVTPPPSSALATAESFGVTDVQGARGTNVMVPVSIANVQNGPIISMIFDLQYDKSVINLVDVQKGDLTSSWDEPAFHTAFTWGARFALVYDGSKGLQNGATGSVMLLNFSVSGEPGATSMMSITNIQLAGPDYQVGTAPARNGTFITSSPDSLGEAVDNTALSWTTGGAANWFAETTTYYYGGDAAQSGVISHNQDSWMQTTISGPGTLSFYWKVSSERNYDWLEFYIDGLRQPDRISGEIDWHQRSYALSSGS